MILPLLGFVAGCVFFSIVGLVVLSRREMISGRNLFVFVVAAMVSSVIVASVCKLLFGNIGNEPLHSTVSFVTVLVIVIGGSVGGLLGVTLVNRVAGRA